MSDIKKNKILVTGASGFIGANCLRALKNSRFEVYATGRKNKPKLDFDVNWIKVDLNDSDQTKKIMATVAPEYLFHIAWGMGPKYRNDKEYQQKWVDISTNLLNHFVKNGGKKVVVSGSCAEYQRDNNLYTEDITPIKPENIYGIYKNKFHEKIVELSDNTGLKYSWARIFFTYGEDDVKHRLLPHIVNTALSGKHIHTTHGNQVYDYLHIEDVTSALVKLLDADFNGPVNICSGKAVRLKDFILKIANELNAMHLVKLNVIKDDNKMPNYIVGNNSRLKKITDWEQKIPLDEGIKKTVKNILKRMTMTLFIYKMEMIEGFVVLQTQLNTLF